MPNKACNFYLLVHVKYRLDVFLVESLGADGTDLLGLFGLVVILPGERLRRDAEADADDSVRQEKKNRDCLICCERALAVFLSCEIS